MRLDEGNVKVAGQGHLVRMHQAYAAASEKQEPGQIDHFMAKGTSMIGESFEEDPAHFFSAMK